MLRVDWAAICRYCEVHDGLFTIVGAGMDRFFVPDFPSPLGFHVALRIVGLPDKAKHKLSLRVLAPDMSEIGNSAAGFTMNPPGPGHPQGWEASVNQPTVVKFMAPAEGAYTLDVAVDGISRTLCFRVLRPPTP